MKGLKARPQHGVVCEDSSNASPVPLHPPVSRGDASPTWRSNPLKTLVDRTCLPTGPTIRLSGSPRRNATSSRSPSVQRLLKVSAHRPILESDARGVHSGPVRGPPMVMVRVACQVIAMLRQ